jgi:hypothetical protein
MNEQKEQNEQEVAFANLGKQVVTNEAYKQAITAREAQIFDVFCSTKADQQDVREEAWRTMVNMRALEQYFEQILTTGKFAEATLELNNKQIQE